MNLDNLIDLIAELAAKRIAQEGKGRTEAPGAVGHILRLILAKFWRL
ncbi:MAG TPA: hypothetical protein PLI43_20020 [Albidovulum sp.]|nr:hypothetical protein [Albidovulum sp.]